MAQVGGLTTSHECLFPKKEIRSIRLQTVPAPASTSSISSPHNIVSIWYKMNGICANSQTSTFGNCASSEGFLPQFCFWLCIQSFNYFQWMVHFFSSDPFYNKYVHLPGASSQVLPQIHYNPKFWPFFKDALSALNGSYFANAPPWALWPFCWNCKGFISQNCLFACSFNFLFTYAMTGRRGQQLMHVFGKMHAQRILSFPLVNIILWMLAILHAKNSSSHTKMYAIILLNGVVLV